MTAGIYALKAGFDVEIYERNTSVGGLCTGWYRKGTYIDGCIHWLTESDRGVLNKLWREIGAIDETVKMFHYEAYSQATCNGKHINFYTDPKKLEAEMLKYAKGNDAKLVKEFTSAVARCNCNAITVHKPYHMWKLWDVVKLLVKIFPIMKIMKRYAKINVSDYVKQFESEELRFLLSNALVPDDYSHFSLVSTFGGLASRNSGTPIGGSKAMAERVKEKYLSLGGKLHLRADVDEIIVENDAAKGIRLASGETVLADYIIPACDVHFTVDKLLKGKYRMPMLDERDAAKHENPVYSMMLLSYRTKADLSNIAFNRYIACKPFDVLGEECKVLYLKHFGYDPTLSTDGYTVVQSIITTNEAMFDKLEAMPRDEYKEYKKQLAQTMGEKLKETIGDEYGELELLDVATPLTFTHYVNAYKGTFMTYMLTKHRKQMIQHNNALPLANIALANHWMMVPGGVPIAVMQGKFAADTIAHYEKKRK